MMIDNTPARIVAVIRLGVAMHPEVMGAPTHPLRHPRIRYVLRVHRHQQLLSATIQHPVSAVANKAYCYGDRGRVGRDPTQKK
jgi:hypothetical protein